MPNFKLINPHIEGKFNKVFSGDTHYEAASKAWNSLASHFTNNMPRFAFTMEATNNKKDIHHFMVKEKINKSKASLADYDIVELDNKLSKEGLKKFRTQLSKIKQQQGGKHKKHHKNKDDDDDSSSSSSSSDSDYMHYLRKSKYNSQPIYYWWYNPYIYSTYSGSLFIPTFVPPLTPYVEVNISPPSSALFV